MFEELVFTSICTSKHLPDSFDSKYLNFNLPMNCMGQMNSRKLNLMFWIKIFVQVNKQLDYHLAKNSHPVSAGLGFILYVGRCWKADWNGGVCKYFFFILSLTFGLLGSSFAIS